MNERRCTVCLEFLPLTTANFAKSSPRYGGFAYQCRSCKSIDNGIRHRKRQLAERPDVLPMAEVERRAILSALSAAGGCATAAASLLGIGRTTLYRKMSEYRLVGVELPTDTNRARWSRELEQLQQRWDTLRSKAREKREREAMVTWADADRSAERLVRRIGQLKHEATRAS